MSKIIYQVVITRLTYAPFVRRGKLISKGKLLEVIENSTFYTDKNTAEKYAKSRISLPYTAGELYYEIFEFELVD